MIALIYVILPEGKVRLSVDKPTGKPRNLLRLAGVINAANTEADNEAGELIERVRKNHSRTLELVAKGHKNESLREQMLAEAEKEQALADLEAAVGDNGGPLLDDPDPIREKIRAVLNEAKSDTGSKSSGEAVRPPNPPDVPQQPETQIANVDPVSSSPEVEQTPHFQP